LLKYIPADAVALIIQCAAKYQVKPEQIIAKADPAVIAARSEAMATLASVRDDSGALRFTTVQLESWFGVGKAAISLARARGTAAAGHG
jgi:hypothetical protein